RAAVRVMPSASTACRGCIGVGTRRPGGDDSMGVVKRIQGRFNLFGLPRRVQVHRECELHGLRRIGWTVCPTLLSAESIVYSFGVGRNIAFDLSLIERFGMTVHAFDPTPFAAGWVRVATGLPAQFRFHEWGLAGYDGVGRFKPGP